MRYFCVINDFYHFRQKSFSNQQTKGVFTSMFMSDLVLYVLCVYNRNQISIESPVCHFLRCRMSPLTSSNINERQRKWP